MSLPLSVLALTIGTAIGAACGSYRCASALAVLAPIWILANGPMEGHVLWTLDREHGLTSADLLTIPMLALAGRQLWRSAEVRRWRGAEVRRWRAGAAPHPAKPVRAEPAPHRVPLTHHGVRGVPAGPRSAARLAESGAIPSDRRVTTARGTVRSTLRRTARRRSGASTVGLSTGGPGGASGD